ncbi:uncharacterized protein LOC123555113 [Mercenaria mercenaria]|uniref:uncharacterized protein LOC123555113 n=1 Tax=Mercenaria mercenaria TaxID=6596 RepID=UPI00234EA1C9|nr:uncharacterized protein LOC123555113 [Mercenaria mercenaria]
MAGARIKILVCVMFIYSVSEMAAELNPEIEVVYDMLTRRIDSLVHDTNYLKSELDETKADFKSDLSAIVSRIENAEAKISAFTLNTDSREEDMTNYDVNVEVKRQLVAVRKMLAAEKALLRKMVDTLENKFRAFESEIRSQISLLNVSAGSSVDGLVHAITDHKLETNNSLMLTDIQIGKVRKDIEENREDLLDAITEVSQNILSKTRSELGSAKNELTRLINDERTEVLSKLVSVERTQENVESKFNQQISQLSKRILEEEDITVAFSARLVTERSHYGKNERIIFDHVDYSHGGGYSASTGIFTAPTSGTYIFTFNVESTSSGIAHVLLKIRNLTKTRVIATKGTDSNAGNAAVDYVWKGEQVWVQTSAFRDKYYIWPYRTTFNGVLID